MLSKDPYIMYSFLFFPSLQNQWQHLHLSSLSIGIQTSLNTTEGVQFVSKTQRTSDYHHCFSSHSMQKAWQFERILSSRVHKSRAMFSKLDARISRRLFMQKAQHELSTVRSLPLSQLYSIVCNCAMSAPPWEASVLPSASWQWSRGFIQDSR